MATTVANMLTWVGYRLFPDGETTISSSSEPNQAECIQWINEVCSELLTTLVSDGAEQGRNTGILTTVDGTSTYTTWDDATTVLDTLFAPCLWYDDNGDEYSAWIEETTKRTPIKYMDIGSWVDLDPSKEGKPTHYIIGSNVTGIFFHPTPDDAYTLHVPYYPYPTILTLTTETVPYYRIFDNVILESVVMRAQNREEYDLAYELKWFSYIRSQAKKILYLKRNKKTRIMF